MAGEYTRFDLWGVNPFARMYREPGYTLEWPGARQEHTRGQGMWSPSVELAERGDELIVRIDLPGVETNDVTVEISTGGLIVKGERKPASPSDQVLISELPYGKFYRLIPLPGEIEEERVSAKFQNGILEISLPAQRPQNRARQIYVAMHPGTHTTDPPPPIKRPPDKKSK